MKNFLLIPNLEKPSCIPAVASALELLRKKDCAGFFFQDAFNALRAQNIRVQEVDDLKKIDAALVFGGDGTVLRAVNAIGKRKIPLIGINTGHLGYLAEVDPKEIEETLDKITSGSYHIEDRISLEIRFGNAVVTAFNEAVIHRGGLTKLLPLEIEINGQKIQAFRGDGVLVATPTGSTAYNLSAGGPIMMPDSDNLVVTPICAHSLSARPIVVGAEDVISLTLKSLGTDDKAILSIDGAVVTNLSNNARVEIKKGEAVVPLIKTKDYSFYKTLKQKLDGLGV